MPEKPALTIDEQIILLKSRGMLFRDETQAAIYLKNISYYRLKGYWWDMQSDRVLHTMKPETWFENIIDRYIFDHNLRIILFDAIEHIEIALRTKMIYHLSLAHGGLWYMNPDLFENKVIKLTDGTVKTVHQITINDLRKEIYRSHEIFIKDHRNRYPGQDADAWKSLEVASLGTLSKLYKNLKNQLPEKAVIAKEMGLNLHSELSSWLEAISYLRNIVAHHSRLWSRNMVKKPVDQINNPIRKWFTHPLIPVQTKKPFLIISCMVYLCNGIISNHHVKSRILELICSNPEIPVYKLGFLNNWDKEPLWQ